MNSPTPYTYELPDERIAERPVYPFHDARMLSINRETREVGHSTFAELPFMLSQDDVLIFNNSKVLKARLFGVIEETQVPVEVLLVEELMYGNWRAIGRPLKKFLPGTKLQFGDSLAAEVIERQREYEVILNFGNANRDQIYYTGTMPIPPYIRDGQGDEQDESDYQTPYAKYEGSVAAPTAGLHFTEELLGVLDKRGVTRFEVTLHVGPASFLPVLVPADGGELELRSPGKEKAVITKDFFEQLRQLKEQKKRIIAVGTTVVRFLETVMQWSEMPDQELFETDLFIEPGYEFQAVDALVTNFHQSRSTHLLLVEAFMKHRELLDRSYQTALDEGYRFLSYGDGMFIE